MPTQRTLLDDGKPLRLGSRALDILVALVEQAGKTVRNSELIARAWPNMVVEEASLRVQIAALRKTLGDGRSGNRFIANVPGRGYSFVAAATRERTERLAEWPRAPVRGNDIPASLTRVIGRDTVIPILAERLALRRFLTIVGPGGIGKTTVAAAVAEVARASYVDGVWFVGLASLSGPDLVPSALGAVLGIPLPEANPISGLTGWLRDKQVLIVLDNCEHVAGAAAALAQEIVKSAPRTAILATSREPLRAAGEWRYRLAPLELPPRSSDLAADEVLLYPAVQLFNERASAAMGEFAIGEGDVAALVEICRRLDGVPLALELAAAHVGIFGVKELAERLNNHLALEIRGRRTALPRHQTLRATLDWSHELLPEAQQVILRRLAVFPGDFTMDAASTVAADGVITPDHIVNGVADLVDKSLIAADVGSHVARYHLLEMTRAYGLEQLDEHDEVEQAARRHAKYCRDLLERAEAEWNTKPRGEWLTCYAPHIDDLRTALDWTLGTGGDAVTGVALTAAAVPLWFEMWLLEECRVRAEHALAVLENMESRDDRCRMQLYAAIAQSQAYTTKSTRDTIATWMVTLQIAESLGDTEYQLRALWGIWGTRVNRGDFKDGLAIAQKFSALAASTSDNDDRLVGDRLIGVALHFLGDQPGARKHIERMLATYVAPVCRSHAVRFQSDQRVTARMYLARILWVQGNADQAVRMAEVNIEDARLTKHPQSVCNALAGAACPIALLTGDLAAAERYTTMLLDETAREALEIWHAHGVCFEGELRIRRGDVERGLCQIRTGVEQLIQAGFGQYLLEFLGSFAKGLATIGQISRAHAAIDDAIERSQPSQTQWYLAELLRIKGGIVLQTDATDAAKVAESHFLGSLDMAREQAALAWELRTATSLARLWRDQDRADEACSLLGSVLDRFSEGHKTVDIRVATHLLNELSLAAARGN